MVQKRGKKIRACDRDLVRNSVIGSFLVVFLSAELLFHGERIGELLKQGIVNIHFRKEFFLTPYFITSITVPIVIYLILLWLYIKFRRDSWMQILHRQKLARMVLENGWYEKEQKNNTSFFKDTGSSKSKEVITSFPKMFYRMKNGLIYINVEVSMGKYQDQLLSLEKKLESGLYCELKDEELKEFYKEYVFLYDMIAERITIDEVVAESGRLKLMKNVYWEYDSLPHMLIAGGTGGGKTYFILTIIEALLKTNSKIYVIDPKNADLADLETVLPDVYHVKEDIVACINKFYDDMLLRSEEMKKMPGYKTGENYAYLGLPANFLIFDEYVAFMDMLGNRENQEVLNKIKGIVMLGRQAGFFIILACQRPDAKYLGDGIRDQFNFRVALGRMSELGYGMMFGETDKKFYSKRIKGRGYLDCGTSVISEFYTPLVPKGHDFLKSIQRIYLENRGYSHYEEKPKQDDSLSVDNISEIEN